MQPTGGSQEMEFQDKDHESSNDSEQRNQRRTKQESIHIEFMDNNMEENPFQVSQQ